MPGNALVMAALLVATGYATLPIGARLYAIARGTDVERTQINFRQSLVQVWIVFPLLLSGLFIGAVLWAEVNRGHLAGYTTYGQFLINGWWHWPFPLSIVFCSLWLLSLCSVRRVRNLKSFLAASLAPFVCVAVLHALLSGIMLLLRGWRDGQVTHAFVVAPPLVLFAFSVTVVVLIGMMGRQSTRGRPRVVEPPRRVAPHLRCGVDDRRGRCRVRAGLGLLRVRGASWKSLSSADGLDRHGRRRALRRTLRADRAGRPAAAAEAGCSSSPPRSRRSCSSPGC